MHLDFQPTPPLPHLPPSKPPSHAALQWGNTEIVFKKFKAIPLPWASVELLETVGKRDVLGFFF